MASEWEWALEIAKHIQTPFDNAAARGMPLLWAAQKMSRIITWGPSAKQSRKPPVHVHGALRHLINQPTRSTPPSTAHALHLAVI